MDERRNRTLGTLLLGSEHTLPSDVIERVREAAKTRENREYIEAEMPHVEWPGVWKGIENRLPDLFDIDLQDIVAGAFKKYRELKKYCDPEKYPASKPVSVPLGEQTLSSTHKPQLEIVIDGAHIGSIEFSIKLQLRLKAAKVELRGGVIRGLDTGDASLNASAWLGKVPLLEKRIAEFDLPGHLDLERGIPLPWSQAAAADETRSQTPSPEPAAQSTQAKTLIHTERGRPEEAPTVRRYYLLPSLALLAGFALLGFVLMENPGRLMNPRPAVLQQDFALEVVTDPPGADVRLADLDTPYRRGMKLPPGQYDLIVTHPGYETRRESILLDDRDRPHRVRLTRARLPMPAPEPEPIETKQPPKVPPMLTPEPELPIPPPNPVPPAPAPPAGTFAVHLSSNPPGADIEILRVGDYTNGMHLKPGRYEVLLRKDGYEPAYFWIQVKDRPVEKRFELPESPWQ